MAVISSLKAVNGDASSSRIPHLRHVDDKTVQLIVDGKPFLMLPGELHNSSLSSARYMSEVWPAMKAQGINTLLGAVTWEMIEPLEGQFDFTELEKVILGAREHQMRLVLLWFGSYKNGMSTYAPGWVKRDVKRFPRVHLIDADGAKTTLEMISPLSEEGWKADAKAFGNLMAHLREFDSEHHTVLMIQVENETGLLGDSRDRSSIAEQAFLQPVPGALLEHLASTDLHPAFKEHFLWSIPTSGQHTWESVFGTRTAANEAFMAYHISEYVGRVAAAGKAAYPIPLYTNVWLNIDDTSSLEVDGHPIIVGGGIAPGVYPSGGPVPHMLDIWKLNAPALEFISPDLYFHNYEAVCKDYTANGNPLFIPEQRRDKSGSRRVWLAYGTYGALGCSPFGIDTEPAHIGKEFRLLSKITPWILSSRVEDRMGFFFDEEPNGHAKERWTRVFGEVELIVERAFVFGKPGPGAGMVIHMGDMRFLLVGYGFQVRFKPVSKEATFAGILTAKEKEIFPDGKMTTLRMLNGDETRSGQFVIMPNEDPDYGGFPIAVTIPARTYIAEVEAYVLYEESVDM